MAHNNTQPLENVPTITLATSLRSLGFRLWDEESKNFVGFKDIKYLTKKSVSTQVKSEL
jgi:omega-6 fatty acid desaturase (delta-12 desaturase)